MSCAHNIIHFVAFTKLVSVETMGMSQKTYLVVFCLFSLFNYQEQVMVMLVSA